MAGSMLKLRNLQVSDDFSTVYWPQLTALAEDALGINQKARIWAKMAVEKDSNVLGDADPSSVLPADFIIPFENVYRDKTPPTLLIELEALKLWAPADSVQTTPAEDNAATPFSELSRPAQICTYPAEISFTVTDLDTYKTHQHTYSLAKDVNFVTAHPCAPSSHVKILRSPSSPTIQQVDLSGRGAAGKAVSVVGMLNPFHSNLFVLTNTSAGHPLHKSYTYTALHLSELMAKKDLSLEALLDDYSSAAHRPSLTPPSAKSAAKFLVIDCITGFQALPQEHEIPLSPAVSRKGSYSFPTPRRSSTNNSTNNINYNNHPSPNSSPIIAPEAECASPTTLDGVKEGGEGGGVDMESASKKMHSETRRRQFGSDMEILVRAFCAEKGWNALISRRRRGCLACAIREAGALGWKVIIRVD